MHSGDARQREVPLHGGAPGPVLDALDAIGTAANARAWLEEAVAGGQRLMGFGHRIYRVRDPHADALKGALKRLGAEGSVNMARFELAEAAEQAALAILREKKPGRALATNVVFYTALLLEALGFGRGRCTSAPRPARRASPHSRTEPTRRTRRHPIPSLGSRAPAARQIHSESIPMPATPSYVRALRLPRDFALIAVGLDAAMFVINMAVLLGPSRPESEQLRSAYATPGVWVTLLVGMLMSWTLVSALAWSHARNALERSGMARVALAHDARLRFGGVWVLAMVLNYYALTPLFYELQVMFMPGGRFEGVFAYSPGSYMGVAMLLQSLVQLVVLVLGVWLAAWVALAKSRVAQGNAPRTDALDATAAVDAPEALGVPPRRAVAFVVAALFSALQLWGGLAAARWAFPAPGLSVLVLVLTWGLPLVVGFALAWWGAWLGTRPDTRPGLPVVRPFRAVSAAVLSFVLVQVGCIVIATVWLVVAAKSSFSFYSGGGIVGFVLALVLVYMALVLALTRSVTRRLYRSYL